MTVPSALAREREYKGRQKEAVLKEMQSKKKKKKKFFKSLKHKICLKTEGCVGQTKSLTCPLSGVV